MRARPGFQSTHPSGVRRLRCPSELPTEPISIHAPQWGATLPQYWHGSVVIFQSTHPSGVRPPGRPVLTARSHFNPRTPVGCDALMIGPICSRKISIHAPQWGATRVADAPQLVVPISIHAPQWGATSRAVFICKTMVFQSTHPSGVRPGSNRRLAYLVLISIHAPQWGATMPWPSILPTTAFQSTHPSGVRLDAGDGTGHVLVISIHAPQWGATSWLSKIVVAFINFNPRTPVGCDT